MTTDSETSTVPTVPTVPKQKHKGGRPLSTIWDDINQGQAVASGKFSASCKYCETISKCGELLKLKEHLSNYCKGVSANIVRKYMHKILERQDKNKKRKLSCDG